MSIALPSRSVIRAVYQRQCAEFSTPGRDYDGMKLGAALAWPRMMVTTGGGTADVFDVAVSLMMSVISEAPFQSGNHRLAFALLVLTLRFNGWVLDLSNREALKLMAQFKTNQISEKSLAEYCRRNALPLEYKRRATD